MKLVNRKIKLLLTTLGIISLALGIVGIVLPILPTTPFLLLSSFLFYKSSKKLHDWLLRNKFFGEYIHNYKKYRAIKRASKIAAIVLLWATLAVSFFLVNNLYIRIGLGVVGIAVTVHLLMIKTLENVIRDDTRSDDNTSNPD